MNWLVLIPTAHEAKYFPPRLRSDIEVDGGRFEIAGFGPVVSAARTAHLLAQHRPSQVVLCGIAGTFQRRLTVGTACRFDAVACYGIGAGSGTSFQTASEMGWQQWGGDETGGASSAIAETIELAGAQLSSTPRLLLSTCAASSSLEEVALKLNKFPTAAAEDMEGFSVAAACRLAGIPLQIVRGISNQAGDRDHRHWEIDQAMQAAVSLVAEMIHP